MVKGSAKTKILWVIMCLGLIVWGLTDVRQRAHYDPAAVEANEQALADHRTDLTVFTEAGAAFFDERDPYEISNPRGWMYLYPPLFAILMAPLHYLQPQWQGVVWYFLSLALGWGCYRETIRLLQIARVKEWIQGEGARKVWLGIRIAAGAAILFPTLDCLQRGQVGILILYLMLLGVRWAMDSSSWQKPLAGGLILALPVVIKIIPALPVLFLLFVLMIHRIKSASDIDRSARFPGVYLGLTVGLFIFFLGIPSIFIGWQANTQHLKTWTRLVGAQAVEARADTHFSNPRSQRNQSLGNALYYTGNQIAFWRAPGSEPNPWVASESMDRFMNTPGVTQVVLVVRIALALILIPVGWRVASRGGTLYGLAAWGLASVAMLVVSPVSRGHYFMLELPAVLFISLWIWKNHSPRKALLCALIPAALSPLHYLFITFPQMFGVLGVGTLFLGTLGIGTALWYVAMALMMIWAPANGPEGASDPVSP